tara:strand:+ start:6762 stop:7766 length:1005 start_codon:yes stop_codon:yes gene_type:complete
MPKKILVLKNDRGGDLVSSIRLINKLAKNNELTIYLSEINIDFKFLFVKSNVKKVNFNLNIIDKIKIFIDIVKNKYDEVFILCPKNFYFYLPLIFKKTKFYALTINGRKRNRPSLFLRKYLHKYSTAYRTKINKRNFIQNQLDLIDSDEIFDYKDLNLPNYEENIAKNLPEKYIFFQFKKSFFDQLNWSTKEFHKIINFIETKYQFILFSSDIEDNIYDKYFEKNFTTINFDGKRNFNVINKKNIIYLRKIDPKNLFLIVKNANKILCPHGMITQIAYLFNKKSINLFSFKINSIEDYHHQKISFSEWYSNMNIKFTFLSNDINKSISKISKFI